MEKKFTKDDFKSLVKSKKFKSYLLNCRKEAETCSKRVWEKSIPLWIATYFHKKGVSVHLFDGNYGCNLKHLEQEYKGNKQLLKKIETARAIFGVARKQKNSAHADFSVQGVTNNPFGMTAVGMLEIKSLCGYQKSTFRTEKIFQDICMCLAYNLVLGKTGSAFMLFFNTPHEQKDTLNKEEVMDYLELNFKQCLKAVRLEAKKQKWEENILIWIE